MKPNRPQTPATDASTGQHLQTDVLEARLAALRSALLFSTWPERVLLQLAEKSRMETVAEQVTVHPVGHRIHSIHVLVSGTTLTSAADSQGRRVTIKLHSRGEVHGLFLWANQDSRAHLDVVTLVQSTFLVIPIPVLEEVMASVPQLWRSIATEASRRLIITMEIAMSFGLESPRIRFARHILEQMESTETSSEEKLPQVVPMSQQVMAELLGVSRQTVTSLVREFEEQGYIHWRYGRISVLDLDGLRSAAKFVWQRVAGPLATS